MVFPKHSTEEIAYEFVEINC